MRRKTKIFFKPDRFNNGINHCISSVLTNIFAPLFYFLNAKKKPFQKLIYKSVLIGLYVVFSSPVYIIQTKGILTKVNQQAVGSARSQKTEVRNKM